MVVTLSFNTHQLAGRIGGGGATALKHKAPRQHRAVVDTRVSANYWEDVNSIARVLDSPSQGSAKMRGESLKRDACMGEPVRAVSASELWMRAETARRTAKSVCSFAVMSANSASFSQMTMTASCAAEWRKVEELEDAAYEAEMVERSVFGYDDEADDASFWPFSR